MTNFAITFILKQNTGNHTSVTMQLNNLLPSQRASYASCAFAMVLNLLMAYAIYMLCRIFYVCVNWTVFGEAFANLSPLSLLSGALLFDTSAILYTNVLYALLMLLPLHYKETRPWQTVCR